MLMASRQALLDEHDVDEEIMFNPAEHKDLAHFFSQVDQAETFALTANEWLGIRTNGQQYQPVGSVGPAPARPNPTLTSATRSLMAFNKPVAVSPTNSRSNSLPTSAIPSTSPMAASVRAWRPHETPFDPNVHGQTASSAADESSLARRPSTSSGHRDHSMDASAQRKRPAPAAVQSEFVPSKRPRSHSGHAQSAPNISPVSAVTPSQSKPPLLTAQQKKANHILSEQKRRAKIRRGYDALCEVVPALKNAVLAEQEAADAKRKKGKQAKGTAAADDGRAGPKSESVVLSQTIEHIDLLLARKEDLLARLRKAQSMLPAGHGALTSTTNTGDGERLWEKEWDGGTGIEDGEDEDEESDEEDTA